MEFELLHASLQVKAEGLETWKTSWVKAGLERRLNRLVAAGGTQGRTG